jgi:hypothetical protein
MAIVQGLVDYAGNVIRAKGSFTVVSKTGDVLRIEVTGQDVSKAFVLATPWRQDGDIGLGNAQVSASPDPRKPKVMIFAVHKYYGLSFRIEP